MKNVYSLVLRVGLPADFLSLANRIKGEIKRVFGAARIAAQSEL